MIPRETSKQAMPIETSKDGYHHVLTSEISDDTHTSPFADPMESVPTTGFSDLNLDCVSTSTASGNIQSLVIAPVLVSLTDENESFTFLQDTVPNTTFPTFQLPASSSTTPVDLSPLNTKLDPAVFTLKNIAE